MAQAESIVVNLKGAGKHEGGMFDAHLAGKPYVWIGDSQIGCYVAIDDLRVLRRMRDALDAVIAKREHRGGSNAVVDGLIADATIMPSERWDEECHRCEQRIGNHLIDGRCPIEDRPPASEGLPLTVVDDPFTTIRRLWRLYGARGRR